MATNSKGDGIQRAAIYARVSTQEQAEQGFSLDNQLETLRQVAEREGYAVAGEYVDDGHSGVSLDRPGLQRLLEDAERGEFGVVLAYKTDRLSRKIRDLVNLVLGDFERLGVTFKSATEPYDTSTPIGRKFFTDMGSFAEFERELLLERTTAGARRRREEGFFHGSIPPSGYRWADERDERSKRRLVLREESETFYRRRKTGKRWKGKSKRVAHTLLDHRTVRAIFVAYLHEGLSAFEISRRHGMVEQTVYQMLRKANFYAGYVTKSTEGKSYGVREPLATGSHPAIISPDEAETVLLRLRETRRGYDRQRSNHPLSGFLACALCGGKLYKKTGGGNRNIYYACNNRVLRVRASVRLVDGQRCMLPYYRMAMAEEAVLAELWLLSQDPDRAREILKREGAKSAELVLERDRLEREVDRLEAKKDRLVKGYVDGLYDERRYRDHNESLEADIQVRRSRLETLEVRLKRAHIAAVPSRADVEAMCAALWHLIDYARHDVAFRRKLYKATLIEVQVGPGYGAGPDVHSVLFKMDGNTLEPLLAEAAVWIDSRHIPDDLPKY